MTDTTPRCTGMTDLFFSENFDDLVAATAICETCPLIEPCLAGAIERREPEGVWGGKRFARGKPRVLRRPGRPRKEPAAA